MITPLITVQVLCRNRLHRLALYPGEATPRLLSHDAEDIPRLRNYHEIGGDIRCIQALDAFIARDTEKVPAKLRPYVPRDTLWTTPEEAARPHTPEEALAQNIRQKVSRLWMECGYRGTVARWPPGMNYINVKIAAKPYAYCQAHYHRDVRGQGPDVYFHVGVRQDWLQVVRVPVQKAYDTGHRLLVLDRLTTKTVLVARPGVGFEVYPWPARMRAGTLRWLMPNTDECRIWVANHPPQPGVQP